MGDGIASTTCQPSERTHSATLSTANWCASGSRTMPPLPTFPRPASNCGLTRMTASASEGAAASTGPSSSVAEMNETSITSSVSSGLPSAAASAPASSSRALVRSIRCTRVVVAQLHGDLAEAGIDAGHAGRTVLQQAVGKSAGRGADVEAGPARDSDLPVGQGRGQLEPAAAHIGHVVAQQPDRAHPRRRKCLACRFFAR